MERRLLHLLFFNKNPRCAAVIILLQVEWVVLLRALMLLGEDTRCLSNVGCGGHGFPIVALLKAGDHIYGAM